MSNKIIAFPGQSASAVATVDAVAHPEATLPPPLRQTTGTCPICRGMKFLRTNAPLGDPQFGKVVPCRCQYAEVQQRARTRTYNWLGGDSERADELEAMTFASFQQKANGRSVAEAFQCALNYSLQVRGRAKGAKNVLLIGPYGVGKTHMACSILNEARAAGVSCLFLSGNEFFQKIYDSDFDERYLQMALTTDLLCFDDLDKMQVKEDGSYQKSTLFTLFNQRDIAKRPTIITANESDDWRRWLHGAVISRLLGPVEVIEMLGRDYRQVGGAR